MTDIQLPAAIEVEKSLLSAMIVRESVKIPIVIDLLTEEDFYRQEHRILFRTIVNIYNEGTPPNFLLIEERLKKTGDIEKITRQYLVSVVEKEFSTARIEAYCEIIKDKSIMRSLLNLGHELMDAACDERNNAKDLLEATERKFLAITMGNTRGGFKALSAVLKKSFERIQHIHNNLGELRGVPTGLADLDKVLNGLHPSDLILLAARPSMGKTALALNIAVHAATKNKKVALFSLEMSDMQLGNRLLSTASGVNSMYLDTGNFSGNDMNNLVEAISYLSQYNLFLDDTSGLTIFDVRSKVLRLRQEHGLDLVVIDYLQLMQGSRSRYSDQNRQQEISEISRNLKSMAREFDLPILALSQLSRNVEMRAEKKPQLSDLRESGSLEQDADIVMFLYRDDYYNRDDTEKENIAELIIAKNRNGPTTSIRLQFQKEIMRFGDLTRIVE